MFQNAAKRILFEQENDQHNNLHRKIFAYVYVPIIQRECNILLTCGTIRELEVRRIKNYQLESQIICFHSQRGMRLSAWAFPYQVSN